MVAASWHADWHTRAKFRGISHGTRFAHAVGVTFQHRLPHWLLVCSLLVGCGGEAKSGPPSGAGAHPGSGGEASAGESGVAGNAGEASGCADTPRDASDRMVNAATLEMASRADPSTLMRVDIGLVDVPGADGADRATKERLYGPYQDPVEEWLEQHDATEIGRFWLVNALSARLEARLVGELLCQPHVVRVEALDPYYFIVPAPWDSDEAGPLECPRNADGGCPEHCFPVKAHPFVESNAGGCYAGWAEREVVACSRAAFGFDDDEPACGERISTGERYGFGMRPVPVFPDFLDFRPCEAEGVGFCEEP
jgi:hypothetical protein